MSGTILDPSNGGQMAAKVASPCTVFVDIKTAKEPGIYIFSKRPDGTSERKGPLKKLEILVLDFAHRVGGEDPRDQQITSPLFKRYNTEIPVYTIDGTRKLQPMMAAATWSNKAAIQEKAPKARLERYIFGLVKTSSGVEFAQLVISGFSLGQWIKAQDQIPAQESLKTFALLNIEAAKEQVENPRTNSLYKTLHLPALAFSEVTEQWADRIKQMDVTPMIDFLNNRVVDNTPAESEEPDHGEPFADHDELPI